MARELPEKSTPIVNEILEKLALAKLAVYEYKVLIAVIRKTYGWNKKTDWISFELPYIFQLIWSACLTLPCRSFYDHSK